ncbi:hypothetical protein ACFQ4L_08340 [Lapidilactobacillus mulanensis]|uniref:Polymerase n=1 Tax=Lapidilactobacillus mulanensis TaxID=2485999 RepID=A0ABW4DN41_9LACO|nr:hypothetical protein [Lapidilactobacillus mulanensis]
MEKSTGISHVSATLKNMNLFFLITSVAIKVQADNIYNHTLTYPWWSIGRHVLFGASLILVAIVFFLEQRKSFCFLRELKQLTVMIALIMLVSVGFLAINGGSITYLLKSVYFIYSAFLYGFLLLNIYSREEINQLVKWFFLLVMILYLFEYYPVLIVADNYMQINFFNSYSPFESSAFSAYFYGCMMFFTLATTNKKLSLLSIAFNLLSFKRVNVIFSIIFFVISLSRWGYFRVKKWILYLLIVLFTIIPAVEYQLMTPSVIEKIASYLGFTDVHGLLMGRDRYFFEVINSNYRAAGFSSATNRLQQLSGHGMEMDGLSTYMEMGILGTSIFSFGFWKFSGSVFRNIFVMFVFFVNYLTSSQLGDTYSLLLLFLTVCLVKEDSV